MTNIINTEEFHKAWRTLPGDGLLIDGKPAHLAVFIPTVGFFSLRGGQFVKELYDYKSRVGYTEKCSESDLDLIEYEVNKDRASLLYVTGWTREYFNRTLQVIHSPKGLEWK